MGGWGEDLCPVIGPIRPANLPLVDTTVRGAAGRTADGRTHHTNLLM